MIFNSLSDGSTEIKKVCFNQSSKQNKLYLNVLLSGDPLPLSDVILIMDNVGLSIAQCKVEEASVENESEMIFELIGDSLDYLSDPEVKQGLEAFLNKIFYNEIENDLLNRLFLSNTVNAQDLIFLRALTKYLIQIKVGFSVDTLYKCLVRYGSIAELLIAYFYTKFNPLLLKEQSNNTSESIKDDIIKSIDSISNRDDDLIFRRYFSVAAAITRTNFYQKKSLADYMNGICLKIEPASIENIPHPIPAYEIFFYSRFVEGTHLRGGKVARGGIRFSDRLEDFRTEVLGLVKAQMVKNSVIVPVGAKGGFVCKIDLEGRTRDDVYLIAKEAYKLFIQSLLDITDNYVDDNIVVPSNVVRYDDDDPYLVVAADKGTATFSDFANDIAHSYHFWLGDAFASGGKNGYDHKKMGITAKGAWESARRLAAETGKNINADTISVVGIGDMSGDVFGNGMLLSNQICLVAAFDHRHIFIDPNPSCEQSFTERKRLFELPHSSWGDYSRDKMSEGGMVIRRDEKKISLTSEIILTLSIDADDIPLSPDELIQRILSAKVDMLWNGGIGTYIKSDSESDFDVDDKANDRLRVNASALRATMIVEGGNLGLTQQARIDYALKGGLIHMDAVDNSAGVDCSDHEVNIKILLNQLLIDKKISVDKRNNLLADMESSVSSLVLRNNFNQSKMLSQSNYTSKYFFDNFTQLINLLERDGVLDRKRANIPSSEEIERRISALESFTRPEIATLLAYSKTRLFKRLVDSDLIEDKFFEDLLLNYFPDKISSVYPDYVKKHPLRKQILSSYLTNDVANRMGATFCNYILEENSVDVGQLIKAHMVTVELFGINEFYSSIDELFETVSSNDLLDLQLAIHYPMDKSIAWFVKNGIDNNVQETLRFYKPLMKVLSENLELLLPEADLADLQGQISISVGKGIPDVLAQSVHSFKYLYHILPVANLADKFDIDTETVLSHYFSVGEKLGIFWLYKFMGALSLDDPWKRKNKKLLQDSIESSHIKVLHSCLLANSLAGSPDQINLPLSSKSYLDVLGLAISKPAHHFSMLTILTNELAKFSESIVR